MQGTTLNYQLPTFSGLIRHGAGKQWFVRDTAQEEVASSELDAQVHSGDYFVLLATKLDQLSSSPASLSVRLGLEEIVSDLLYLQQAYKIVKKDEQ